jgi:DNA-binding LacI/PurR family transcriptional regulator/biotin operon repressor
MPLRSSGGRPLADQIYATLSRRIDAGAWKANDRLPSERALAEELGVCRVTVARAVNRLVSEGVLCRRRGSGTFVASHPDGSHDRSRPVTGAVALVIPYSRDGYASHIVKGVASVLSDAGYHVLFHDTGADWRREAHQIQRLRGRVDGFLVFPADPMRNEDLYRAILAEGTPLVFIDRYCPTLASDWVVTDNFNASLHTVRRLLAEGRRRIVHITTAEIWCTSTQDRRLGYCQALLEAGLPVRPEDIRIATPHPLAGDLHDGPNESSLDYALGVPDAPPLDVQGMVHSLLRGDAPMDALFAVNDWTMLACLHALHREGVRVPEDVAVAAFADNDMVTAHLPVPILTINQPKDEIGRRAAEILIDRLTGDTSGPHQVFLPATIREAGGVWSRLPFERAV